MFLDIDWLWKKKCDITCFMYINCTEVAFEIFGNTILLTFTRGGSWCVGSKTLYLPIFQMEHFSLFRLYVALWFLRFRIKSRPANLNQSGSTRDLPSLTTQPMHAPFFSMLPDSFYKVVFFSIILNLITSKTIWLNRSEPYNICHSYTILNHQLTLSQFILLFYLFSQRHLPEAQ